MPSEIDRRPPVRPGVTPANGEGGSAAEAAELRKKLEQAVAEKKALRSTENASAESPASEPPLRWQPPKELSISEGGLHILLRMVIFALVVAAGYVVVRWATYVLFAPQLETIAPVIPPGPIAAGQSITVGARVANTSKYDGAGFVVVAFSSGQEIEGATVEIKAGDTVFVPVDVRLAAGTNVFTLLVFDAWRGTRRLSTFPGLTLTTALREFEVHSLVVSEAGAGSVEFSAANRGHATETVIPVLLLRGDGTLREIKGTATAIPAGETRSLRVELSDGELTRGRYFLELSLQSPSGEVLGGSRYPAAFEVGP